MGYCSDVFIYSLLHPKKSIADAMTAIQYASALISGYIILHLITL